MLLLFLACTLLIIVILTGPQYPVMVLRWFYHHHSP